MTRGAGQKRICAAKCLYRFKPLFSHTSFAITSIERGTTDLLLGWWTRRNVEEFQRNGKIPLNWSTNGRTWDIRTV